MKGSAMIKAVCDYYKPVPKALFTIRPSQAVSPQPQVKQPR
jgi:hypothetical protein